MSETQTIERNGRRWRIGPAAEPLLAAGWLPDDLERLPAVKRGRGRTVYRCEAGGAAFYVKAYAGDVLRRLRAWLGFGPGRREWEALRAARAAGLDVPEPVALALGPAEVLVTREVAGGQRLDEYLFDRYFEPLPADPPYPGARPPELVSIFRRRRLPPPGTIDPRSLARAVADLVARLAEADLYLADLHPGNLLVSGGPGRWRLSLLDLAEAEQPAPPEAPLEHLVQLEHFFEPIASVAERLRCLRHVREFLGDAPAARLVARAAAVYRQRFYRRRDRRTRHESKYFRRITAGAWRGWAAADWAETVERLLAGPGPDALLTGPASTPLKQGRSAGVWRVALEDGRALVVKRHLRADRRAAARGFLTASRSLAAFRKGHALLARGVATARPAAALDLRRHGKVRDTLLVAEAVEGEKLSDWLRGNPPPRLRRHVIWLLARMLRRMHDAGFSHRDLKAPNLLVAPSSGPGTGPDAPALGPVLVDLDGLRYGRRVSARRRARDLMRLSVSLDEWGVARRTDRLRFLRAYLGRRGCPRAIAVRGRGRKGAAGRLRRWWRRIARLSERKHAALARKNPG